jgi:soluble lytic murein transglycosylase-like protein
VILPRTLAQAQKLPVFALLVLCSLPGAPNVGPAQGRFQQAAASAIEKQCASARLQMARISESASRLAGERARPSWEKQRGAIERQRRSLAAQRSPIEKQLASVERQLQAVRPEGALYTMAEQPAVVSWRTPAQAECRRISPAEIDDYVEQVAKRESLAPELLHVVIARESSFLPCAVSPKGAIGMMQLMPGTAADLGVANPFDPEENIDGGARYLGYLMQRFRGDLSLALAAYNAGPRRVDNYRGVPPIPETLRYVSSILRQLRSDSSKILPDQKTRGRI